MKQAPLTLRRWRRVEYERLVDLGAFEEGEPVELIGGQLIVVDDESAPEPDLGIVDYWVVNLVDRVLEVYRDAGADVTAPYGWRYMSVERVIPPSSVTPVGITAASIPVAALLP